MHPLPIIYELRNFDHALGIVSQTRVSGGNRIQTYKIGYCSPSIRTIDLVSHTTQVVCVNFLHVSGGTYNSTSATNERFLEKLFMAILFTLRVFDRKILFVFCFYVCPGAGFISNKPTHYILDYLYYIEPTNLILIVQHPTHQITRAPNL